MTDGLHPFELPDPTMNALPWLRDGMHVPRPIPPLVGDALNIQMETVMGRPAAIVNGYSYMGLGPGPEMLNMEQAPQAEAGEAWRDFYLPRVKAIVRRLRDADYAAMPAPALATAFPGIVRDQAVGFGLTMAPLMQLTGPAAALMEFCARHFGRDGDILALTLIAGRENETVAAGDGLEHLASLARELPAVAARLRARDFEAIAGAEGGTAFLAAFRAYLAEYGMGNQTWFEFHRPSWSEEPSVPLATIASLLDHDSVAARARAVDGRTAALAEALGRLPGDVERDQLRAAVAAASNYVEVIEDRALWQLALSATLRRPSLVLGAKLAAAGALPAADDIFFAWLRELEPLARGETLLTPGEVARRRADWDAWATLRPPETLGAPMPPVERIPIMAKLFGLALPRDAGEGVVAGHAASRGRARGTARVILDLFDSDRFEPGDVLVCPFTAPPWTPLFGMAAAVVTDAGGVLSHAGIAAREYGIPAVLGTRDATLRIPDGALVEVDGDAGTVTLLA